VLSDSKLEATRAFGIGFRVDADTVERYLGYGVDLDAVSGEGHHVLPAPSTFLIGKDGMIRFQYTNPDYAVRLDPTYCSPLLKPIPKTATSASNALMRPARQQASKTIGH